jgi:hypothetical protein
MMCFAAGKSSVSIKDGPVDDPKDKLKWKWGKGTLAETPARATFGDPVAGGTGYKLCIYDEIAGIPALAVGANIDAGGNCGTKPCWSGTTTKGWKYKNKAGNAAGITGVALKGGAAGEPSVQVQGKGSMLPLSGPAIPQYFEQDARVIVQLYGGSPMNCWAAEHGASNTKLNDAEDFKAKIP